MSKRIFSQEEVNTLVNNRNVAKCSKRSITYSTDFKKGAVKQYNEEGRPACEIFEAAGFDIDMIGKDTPSECLKRWRRTVLQKGLSGLSESRGGKGGRPKTSHLSDKEKIEYLETKIAYLKAENAFLAELRAKKRAE
jgi:transposase